MVIPSFFSDSEVTHCDEYAWRNKKLAFASYFKIIATKHRSLKKPVLLSRLSKLSGLVKIK